MVQFDTTRIIVTAQKLTTKSLSDKACSFTRGKQVSPSLAYLYHAEHSPIRTQIFWIEMTNIPTFASTHFARHKIGIEHFIKSNRDDSPNYTGDLGRYQPVNHAMLANAQSLINIARKRLCRRSHHITRHIMAMIKNEIKKCDPDLADSMVTECEYRGHCPEGKLSCQCLK